MKNVLVLGATSAIAQDYLTLLPRDIDLYLMGRNQEKLDHVALKLSLHKSIHKITADFSSMDFKPESFFSQIKNNIDTIISFAGDMGDENQAQVQNLEAVHAVNFLNPAKTILFFLPELRKKQDARIAVVSSVAGNRGRKKNYVYGSAKGALTIFASGLRAELSKENTAVTTILLGLVDSPMTAGMKSPLIANRANVAQKIHRAIIAKKDVVYIPGFWRWIMLVIQCLPEKIFKKLSF